MTNQKQLTALEQAAAAAGQRLTGSLAKLPQHERQLVVTLTAQVQSLLSAGQLALFGYDAAQAGHTSFSKMAIAPPTSAWVQASGRTKVAVVVIGMVASTLANLLESFLVEISGGQQELELHRRSDGAEWAREVESRLELELGTDARQALASIIDVRRAFSAELDALPPSPSLVGSYAAWPAAVVVLVEAVIDSALKHAAGATRDPHSAPS